MGNSGEKAKGASDKSPSPSKMAEPKKKKEVEGPKSVDIMGKYDMDMSQDGLMGAGTSSICRKGTARESGAEVGIKVYKTPKAGKADDGSRMTKFVRQLKS